MPWTWRDADEHKKGLSTKQKKQWAAVANSVLRKCMADGGSEGECAASAIRQANGSVKTNEMEQYASVHTDYEIQTRMYQGRSHWIVPVVMMVEGVHHGSHGPLLHLAEELGRFPGSWDGIPVMIGHPEIDGFNVSANMPDVLTQAVGRVFNTHMEDNKLKAEVWLDEQKLMAVSPMALEYIRSGRHLEVSVGVFSDEDPTSGVYTNDRGEEEQYVAIARNHRPDHLALLPGEVGACNWNDGCGIRANSSVEPEVPIVTVNTEKRVMSEETTVIQDLKQFAQDCILSEIEDNKQGYQQLMMKLQSKLDALDDEGSYHMLEEVYEDSVVYRKHDFRTRETSLYKQTYSVDANEEVSFVGDALRVRRDMNYVQFNKMKRTNFSNINNNKDVDMDKPCCLEKVVELIGNERTRFSPEDKDWLLTMTPEQLEKLTPVDPPPVAPAPQVNMEEFIRKDSLSSYEAVMNAVPDDVKELMSAGLELHNQHRAALISNILAQAKEGSWTEDELKSFKTTMLEKLNGQFKEPENYAGKAAGGASEVKTDTEPKLLPFGV